MSKREQSKENLKRLQEYMWAKREENKDPKIRDEKDKKHQKIRDEKSKRRAQIAKNKAKRKKRSKNKKSRGDVLEVMIFGKTVAVPTSPKKEKMCRKSKKEKK